MLAGANRPGCTWLEPGKRGESCGDPEVLVSTVQGPYAVRRCKKHAPRPEHRDPRYWKDVNPNELPDG